MSEGSNKALRFIKPALYVGVFFVIIFALYGIPVLVHNLHLDNSHFIPQIAKAPLAAATAQVDVTCKWVGTTSTAWATSTNWTSCSGGTAAQAVSSSCAGNGTTCFFAEVNSAAANQPSITTAVTLGGFVIGSSTNSSTTTVGTGGSITIANSGSAPAQFTTDGGIASSLVVGGASTTGVVLTLSPSAAACLTTNDQASVTSVFANATITGSSANGATCVWLMKPAASVTITSNGTIQTALSITLQPASGTGPPAFTNGSTGVLNLTSGTFTTQTNNSAVNCSNATRSNNTFFNVAINRATTMSGSCLFAGTLTVATGIVWTTGAGTHEFTSNTVAAPLVFSGTGSATITAANTMIFSGTGASNAVTIPLIANSAIIPYKNLTLAPTTNGSTYTLGAASSQTLQVANTLTLGDASHTVTVTAATNNPTITLSGALTINASVTYTKGSGTTTFNAGGAQTLTDNTSGQDLGAVVTATASTNVSTATNIKLTTLTIAASTTWDISNDTMSVTGSGTPITNNNTFTITGSTVEYTNASATILNMTYAGLKISAAITASTTAAVGGALTTTAAFAPTAGTITLNNGASIVTSGSAPTFFNLTTAGSATVTTASNFSFIGTFTNGSSASFTASSASVITSTAGTISNGGTLLSFYDLTIGTGTTTANTSYTVSDILTVTGTLSPTSGTITLSGSGTPLSIGGTFSPSSNNRVTYSNASITTITNTTYPKLTISGTVSTGTQTFSVSSNFDVSGTFTPSAGTVTLSGTSTSITRPSGTLTFNNLTFTNCSSTCDFSPTFSINGAFTLSAGSAYGLNGNAVTFNNGSSIVNSGTLGFGDLTIAASATVTTSASFLVGKNLTVGGSGIFAPSGGTITIQDDAGAGGSISNSGSLTFNNLTTACTPGTITANTSFTVSGTLTNASGCTLSPTSGTITLSGSGTPFVNSGTFSPSGTSTTKYSGTSATDITTVTYNNLTVDAASGTPTYTLAGNTTVSGALNVTTGTLSQGTDKNLTSGAVTVGASGVWSNIGTGDVTLSGAVANAGSIVLNSNNGSQCTDAANDIVVTSSVGGTQRAWSGAGTFTIYNVSYTDMTGAGVTAYNSTASNSTWTVGACTVTVSGTTNAIDSIVVKVAINGVLDAVHTGSTLTGAWSITTLTITSGQTITVWLDNVADASESTAVAKYDGGGNMTGIVLNTNVLSIGSVDDQSITLTNMDLYDCASDEDVMYRVNSNTLEVQGSSTCAGSVSNSYADETIQVESGDTLTVGSGETLSTDNVTITGTLTQTTTGIITATGNLATSGTFNGGSGAITLSGNFSETAGTFTSTSGTLTVPGTWTHTAGGTFTANGGLVTKTGNGQTWDVASSETFYDFTVGIANTAILTISSGDTLVVAHTFTQTDGSIDTGTVEAQGGVTIGAGADTSSGTLSFLVAGDQVITNGGGGLTMNLNINKPSGTVSVSGGNLTVPTFTLASVGTGAFTSTSGTLTIGNSGGTGTWTHTAGGTFNHNNGNVTNAGKSATWNVSTSETFYDLTVSNTATLTISSGDTLVVAHTFTYNDGAIGTGTVEAQGGVTIGAGADAGNGTLSFLVAGDQVITNTGGGSIMNLNINKPSGTVSVSGGNLAIGNFTLASVGTGAFTSTSGTLTVGTASVSGAWTHTGGGTFTANGGGVTKGVSGNTWDVSTSETFYDLTVNMTSGQTLTIASGDSLIVSHTFTHTDGLINTGTVEAQGAVSIGAGADGGTGKLTFSGATSQTYTVTAGGLEMDGDIVVNKTSQTDTVTLGSNVAWNATNQDVTVTSGTFKNGGFSITGAASSVFTVSNGATFEMSGSSAYPATYGTYTYGATSTVRWAQSSSITITNATYGNLEIKPSSTNTLTIPGTLTAIPGNLVIGDGTNAGTVTAATNNTAITLRGNLTIGALVTYTKAASGVFTFAKTGGGTETWTDSTATPQDIGIVQVSASGGVTTLSTSSNVTATSITVDTSQNLNIDSDTLTLTGASTPLTLSGSNTFTVTGSTVEYTNASATITNTTFAGLKISAAITASTTATVGGALTTTAAFAPTAGTITLNNGASIVTSGSAPTFFSLTTASSATVTTASNFSFIGTLTNGSTASFTASSASSITSTAGTISNGGTLLSFYDLTIGTGTTTANTSYTVSHTLTVTGTLSPTSGTITLSGSGTPLSIGGTFSPSGTQTVAYTGTTANVNGITFINLTLGGTGTYTLPAADITLRGNLIVTSGGSVVKSAANKIIFAKGGTQTWTDGNGTAQDIGNIQISSNTTDTTVNLSSSVKASAVTIDASQILSSFGSNTLTLSGNFTNNGTFTQSTGTVAVVPDSRTSTIAFGGDSTTSFYNFTASDANMANSNLQFTNGKTFSFSHNLTLAGSNSDGSIILNSDSAGHQWTIYVDPLATVSLSYIFVTDSACGIDTHTFSGASIIDGGNNGACWVFYSRGGGGSIGGNGSGGGSGGGTGQGGGGSGGSGGSDDSGGGTGQGGGGSGGGGGGESP